MTGEMASKHRNREKIDFDEVDICAIPDLHVKDIASQAISGKATPLSPGPIFNS